MPGTGLRAHLLYDRVSFSNISEAFLVELSIADMREACSLQLFSVIALYMTCMLAHKSAVRFIPCAHGEVSTLHMRQ